MEQQDFKYHGSGVAAFLSIDNKRLMRMHNDGGGIVWYEVSKEGYIGIEDISYREGLENLFSNFVETEVEIVFEPRHAQH